MQAVFAVFQVFGLRAVQHAHLCAVGVVLVEGAVGERQAHRVFGGGGCAAAVFALPPPQGDEGGDGDSEEVAAGHGRAPGFTYRGALLVYVYGVGDSAINTPPPSQDALASAAGEGWGGGSDWDFDAMT